EANRQPGVAMRSPVRDFERSARIGDVDDPQIAWSVEELRVWDGQVGQQSVATPANRELVHSARPNADTKKGELMWIRWVTDIPQSEAALVAGGSGAALNAGQQQVARKGRRLMAQHCQVLGRGARVDCRDRFEPGRGGIADVDHPHARRIT